MLKLVVLSVFIASAASKPSGLLNTLSASSSSITTQEKTEIHHGPAIVSAPLVKTSEYIETRPSEVHEIREIHHAPIETIHEVHHQVPVLKSEIIAPAAVSHQFRSEIHHREPVVQTQILETRPLVEVKRAEIIPAVRTEIKEQPLVRTHLVETQRPVVESVETKTRFVEHHPAAPIVQTEILEQRTVPLVKQTEISHRRFLETPTRLIAAPASSALYEYGFPRYAVSPHSRYATVDRYEIPTFAAATEYRHLPLRFI